MTDQTIGKRYFSIKWQAFSLTSIVLAIICGAFLYFISESTLRQFEIGRSHVYSQNKQQIGNLIEVAAEKIIQFASTSTANDDLPKALAAQDQTLLQEKIDELSWTLQVDAGIEDVSVFSANGGLMASVGSPGDRSLLDLILSSENPQWSVSCDSKCYVQGGTPIIFEDRVVGALLLSEPLSNVMLRFQHISNIDTGLLTNQKSASEFDEFIPSWDKSLIALTNPHNSKAIINSASILYSLKELTEGVNLVDINNEVFELRALPLKDNQVVVISNVSQDVVSMERSQDQSVRISIISLVVAELLLLVLLWKPMTRLRKTANILPLLAEHRFGDAKRSFRDLSKRNMFSDETDLLNVTGLKLSTELESLQGQLDNRAAQLTLRGEELEKERDFVNQLLDTVHAIIIIQDENGNIQLSNKFAVRISGFSSMEMRGKAFTSLLDDSSETDRISNRIADVVGGDLSEYQHEAVLKTRDDEKLHLAWRHAVLYNHDQDSRQVLSVAVDISARVKAEQELAWLANHDTLSGLLNRRRFEEELHKCLAESDRFSRNFAVVFIDLDDFKLVNDNCGHYIGDELIKAVARSLECNSRATDVVARLGGDEFGIILRSFKDDELSVIVERHRLAFTQIRLEDDARDVRCSASVGVATMQDGDKCIDDVVAHADAAMYEAKKAGKNNWCLYRPSMDQ